MKLLGNNLLVEPLPQKQISAGGIHLAQQYRDDAKRFRVLAVGPGRKRKDGTLLPPEPKVGDCILANLYHGNRLAFDDGTGRLIIDANEAILVWNNEKA